MNRTITRTFAVALTASGASVALAGIPGVDLYDSRASFEADAGALSLEDFTSETLGDLALPTTLDSGLGVGLTSGAVSSYIGAGDPDGFGFFNTLGIRNYLAFGQDIPGAGAETGSYTVEFSFASVQNAFGFDLSGFQPNSAANGFNVTTLNGGQTVDDFFVPSDQVFDTVEFYGFIADSAFDAFRVNIPVLGTEGDADYVAFDGVVWGVPTPGTAAILALAGLGAARPRRG